MNQIPASTQWTLDAAGDTGRSAVNSVFMIVCPQTGSKGSGFLIEGGLIVTNEHVVRGGAANQIFVVTAYPGNSPANMEKLITRPLEKEINAISGVDEITSSSSQGFSTIDIKFNFDMTPSEALRKVKDAVDKVKSDSEFPNEAAIPPCAAPE